MTTFDATSREVCIARREQTATPLQALVLLNDPIYVEAARVFAQNMLKQSGSWNDRLEWAFERALSRPPTLVERRILSDLHQKTLAEFRGAPAEAAALIHEGELPVATELKPAELAAMTTVARTILNLHETITRN